MKERIYLEGYRGHNEIEKWCLLESVNWYIYYMSWSWLYIFDYGTKKFQYPWENPQCNFGVQFFIDRWKWRLEIIPTKEITKKYPMFWTEYDLAYERYEKSF